MKVDKTKRRAQLVTIAFMIVATLLGGGRSLYRLRDAAEASFFAEDSYGYSMAYDYDRIIVDAKNMMTVINRYDALDTDFTQELVQVTAEMETAGAVADRKRLSEEMTELFSRMESDDEWKAVLTKQDLTLLHGLFAEAKACKQTMRQNAYNERADAFNRELAMFPASVFGGLLRIDSLSVFE